MTFSLGTFASPVDGTALATYTWDAVQAPVGVVQVAHGLAEHHVHQPETRGKHAER